MSLTLANCLWTAIKFLTTPGAQAGHFFAPLSRPLPAPFLL